MSDIKCLEIFQIEIGPICFRDTGKIGQIVKLYMYMGLMLYSLTTPLPISIVF